jgi:ABC-2 type transport system ATP-binding protein
MRQQIGYLPQALDLPEHLTPYRLLHYLAQMRHVSPSGADEIVSKLALDAIMHKRLLQLSGGQLRLVGIAQAFLRQPELLLLDELTSGLDVVERERVYRLLSERGQLTIFSTHILEEAERIADAIIVLHHGRILFHGTCAELKAIAETDLPQDKAMTRAKKTAPQVRSIQVHYNGQTRPSHEEDKLLLHGSAYTVDSAIEKAYSLLLSRTE